jgi:hypothetical protein
VDSNPASRAAALAASRLLIHAEYDLGESDRHHESRLQRLRAIQTRGPWNDKRAPLNLQIDDLQGHRVHAVDDAGPLIDVFLPAGTYHVSVHLGKVRRSYTLTLEPGTSFDLYPRLAPDRL